MKNTIKKYKEIMNTHVNCYEHKCFFAFDNKQLTEGKVSAGIKEGDEIFSAGGGLYGTHDGITAYFEAINKNTARIAVECDPQEVYDYEYANHECGYIHDDSEAINAVAAYFGNDIAKTIKRRNAYKAI